MTISGWVYAIAVGFNAAANVRVSNELGARHPKSVSFVVIIVTLSSFFIAVILCRVISYAFTGITTVAKQSPNLHPSW
ncbi:hypothetical protein CsSME_00030972 [Camellia sinensis var. sinensis]